jgi:large conductance mechanosensitive channel
MKNTLNDFKAFILRGNVIDLAVGVIIGGAFGKIVNSLITDIIMPPIGIVINNVDFRDLKLQIGGTAETPVFLSYGNFFQITFEFLMIATVIFFIIRFMSKLRRAEEAPAPTPEPTTTPEDVVLLTEIRDLLKQRNS